MTDIRDQLHATLGLPFAVAAAFTIALSAIGAQGARKLDGPLPIDVALTIQGHNTRSPIAFSPDGQWLSHTIETVGVVPRDTLSMRFAATGFPFAEGGARMQAVLTNLRSGAVVPLAGGTGASWGSSWSPDGDRVAFYSDEGGTAGLWIWNAATRKSTRFPGIIARPYFGFELPRWSADGQRVLCKILPSGVSIAQANALSRPQASVALLRAPAAGEPSVAVRRFEPMDPGPRTSPARVSASPGGAGADWLAVDLVLLDLRTSEARRIAEHTAVRQYAFSPDGRLVAYTVVGATEPNSQQRTFDLVVYDLAAGTRRTLVKGARMSYGIEWNWSPDNRTIAYISSGQLASGRIVTVSIASGATQELAATAGANFDPGDGEQAPLWSSNGRALFAISKGQLWKLTTTNEATIVADIPDWRAVAVVTPFVQPTIWSTDSGRTVYVVARRRDGTRSAIYSIDVESRHARAIVDEPKTYSGLFNLAASTVTGDIAFVSTDQQHPQDAWVVSTRSGALRQASHLNVPLERFELGHARVIDWQTADGEALHGTLLLPASYAAGRRLPLVVFVYGGELGSRLVDRFGLAGENPVFNMHVLATRGYAVLAPDAPLRSGRSTADLLRTVMPGVDAAIRLGYADSSRLAVMGQSYGSYSTLALITNTPRFKAAVITGVDSHPDLFADYLFGSTGYYENGQGNMGGTIWEQRDRYFENSPIFNFDRIVTPLLIGQGEKDASEPANAIFVALERLGKPVEYRRYGGESHVISDPANVRDFWTRRLEFLAERLDVAVDASGEVILDGTSARSRH